MSISKFVARTLFFAGLVIAPVSAEQVGKVSYKGQPETLNKTTVNVPFGSVAMSEEIHVDIPAELLKGATVDANPSIMFVLDNSGSMWNPFNGNPSMDVDANRFKVTSRLIDSIYAKSPHAEVGLSIFAGELYCKKSEDPIFKTVKSTDGFGYIPLLKLDSVYTSKKAGKKTGREILKYYLQTNGKTNANPLSYYTNAAGGTNITAGFDGATHAFTASANNKSRQYAIFISDGDATDPRNDSTEIFRFQNGTNVPTTFTIFFSKDGTVPATIQKMTDNIKKNNYSVNNDQSTNYAYKNTTEDELMTFVMDNVVSVITQKTDASVANIQINGNGQSNWDKATKTIKFGDMIPLKGVTTPFKYEINYKVNDTVVVDGKQTITNLDTTLVTDFDITIKNGTTLKDPLSIQWWDRTLGIYVDGNSATALSATNPNSEIWVSPLLA